MANVGTTEATYVRNAAHSANMHAANSWSPNMHAAAKWRTADVHAAAADVHATTTDVHAATTADMHSAATTDMHSAATATEVPATSTAAAPSWKRRGWSRQQHRRSQQDRAQSNQMSTHRVLPSFRQRRERGASVRAVFRSTALNVEMWRRLPNPIVISDNDAVTKCARIAANAR
jgi:hypothetical protein